jgi:hypothetical protein
MLLYSNQYSDGEDKDGEDKEPSAGSDDKTKEHKIKTKIKTKSSADKYMKNLMIYYENKLKYISDDNKFNGFIVFLFHYLLQFIVYYLLLFFPISFSYYAIVLFWLCIVFSNVYLRGCLLTKVERHLWKTKEWLGPQFFFYDSCSLSNVMLQNLFICKVIFIATIIYLRILFNY